MCFSLNLTLNNSCFCNSKEFLVRGYLIILNGLLVPWVLFSQRVTSKVSSWFIKNLVNAFWLLKFKISF